MRHFTTTVSKDNFDLMLHQRKLDSNPEQIGNITKSYYYSHLRELNLNSTSLFKVLCANDVLESRGLPKLSIEEIKYLLDPTGMSWDTRGEPTQEELQKLSGFTVDRIIKPYPEKKS